MTEKNRQKNPYPLGAQPETNGIRFSFVSENRDCGILLYDSSAGKGAQKIPFAEEDRTGNIYCKTVQGVNPRDICYQFYSGQAVIPDEHARCFVRRSGFGKKQKETEWRAGVPTEAYDWENDRSPEVPYHNAMFYCMHVRGFTKHTSSGVIHKGTFLGIVEKIPYLKDIGVTTVELQPAYEFAECPDEREKQKTVQYGMLQESGKPADDEKVNYWGYKKGYYYTPKAAYAAGENASEEFKDLVKKLHQNGMELVMQFYFPDEVNRNEISQILQFWVLEYHVDGFHLMGDMLPVEMLATNPLLADRKLLYYDFSREAVEGENKENPYPHLAEYNDGYLYDMRRFLKGDENMLNTVLRQMRYIPEKTGRIHYLSNYYGFTLADLVSYDHKHNEANGEGNRDGNDYNCSWNCGEEGVTRSRKIKELRIRQIKNAMGMLLFTQSTPLIFMGDEFGNSQKGNNNPWCQDNSTAWLDWNMQKKNGELLEFWKKLVVFRREHPILHPERELRLTDYISCGYPDLSYHGENAWRPQTESYYRHIGMLFCERYAKPVENAGDTFLYLAINMHWEKHELALPRLPKGMRWETVISTEGEKESPNNTEADNQRVILPRSMKVFMGLPVEDRDIKKRRKPKTEG